MDNPQRPINPPNQAPVLHIAKELVPVYANLVRITHLPSELVFDFALKLPGPAPANVLAQVMMSPLSAKLFYRALADNLSKYEAVFGEIKIPGEDALVEYSRLFRPKDPGEK